MGTRRQWALAETETLASQDRDETKTLASPAELRPRRLRVSRRDRDVEVRCH